MERKVWVPGVLLLDETDCLLSSQKAVNARFSTIWTDKNRAALHTRRRIRVLDTTNRPPGRQTKMPKKNDGKTRLRLITCRKKNHAFVPRKQTAFKMVRRNDKKNEDHVMTKPKPRINISTINILARHTTQKGAGAIRPPTFSQRSFFMNSLVPLALLTSARPLLDFSFSVEVFSKFYQDYEVSVRITPILTHAYTIMHTQKKTIHSGAVRRAIHFRSCRRTSPSAVVCWGGLAIVLFRAVKQKVKKQQK